jgi:serine/threonine-protein kinase
MIGRAISHYRIIEKLGEGGMGVVYKAEDAKLKRLVALKFLPKDVTLRRPERERFTREAQAASALNHPNICTIHEIDEAEGEMFIAMEFVQGRSLRQLIDAGPMAIDRVIAIAQNVAEGLAAAHAKGIIHRDIKPENIIITNEGIAKIADFGLARSPDDGAGSRDAVVSGTVSYMAPEQLRGDAVDHRADLWSLGVVLYEMWTGRRPFTAEYEQALSYTILHEKHQSVSTIRPEIPVSLEKVIDRCLEKAPLQRYPDARTFLDALAKVNPAAPDRRAGVLVAIAVLPFADISPEQDNKFFSDGLTEEIITNLSRLKKVRVVSRASVMSYERAGKTTKQIAGELGVQYVLEGSVRKHGADLRVTTQLIDAAQDSYLWADQYGGTVDEVFDIQENVAARVVKALRVRMTPGEKRTLKKRPTRNSEAYQLYLKGRFFWSKRSKEAILKAMECFEEAIKIDANYALAWAGISDSYNLLTEYADISRQDATAKARAAVEKALQLDPKLAEAHTSMGLLYMLNDWDWANAEREFKKALKLDPNYATARHWYAEWLMFNGRTEEAIRENMRAGELDPLSPAILKDTGLTFYYAKEYDRAIEYAKRTLELEPTFASAHRLLSLAYQGKGMFRESLAEVRQWSEMLGHTPEAMLGVAQCQAAAGNREEALRLLGGIPADTLSNGILMRAVGLVHAALGDNDEAIRWFEKAMALRSEALSSLNVDPKLSHLRSDPRFAAIVRAVGVAK